MEPADQIEEQRAPGQPRSTRQKIATVCLALTVISLLRLLALGYTMYAMSAHRSGLGHGDVGVEPLIQFLLTLVAFISLLALTIALRFIKSVVLVVVTPVAAVLIVVFLVYAALFLYEPKQSTCRAMECDLSEAQPIRTLPGFTVSG